MEIIPAIDLIEGKCVRLTQGNYTQKTVYHEDPLEVALAFEQAGIRRLHLVDLDGAKAGRIMNQHVLERLASKTRLAIDFGGGLKTDEDLQTVFNAGACMAVTGSVAVKNKALFHSWIRRYGPEKIMPAADVKNGYISIGGWQENTTLTLNDFIKGTMQQGIRRLFCTDISKDGLLQGPALGLYQQVIAEFPELALIASGGVSSVDDLRRLKDIGCKGAIIGKAIYENRITMNDIISFTSYA